MKKVYVIFVLLLFAVSDLHAQLKFKAGLVSGPNGNTVDIILQPTVNFTGYFTNVIFIFQIPVGVTQPTITKTSLSPYFTFSTDLPTLPNEAGYVTYGFASVNSSNTTNVSLLAGDSYPVVRLTFLGGTLTPADVRLSHLANGGPSTLYQNYIEANAVGPGTNDYTNYVQMFFGSVVLPPAPFGDEATGYANYQYTQRSQVLPVNWLSFTAVKQGNNGLLNWAVANQDDNHHYELQRSTNGTDFTTIATINKSGNGVYSYTDLALNNLGSTIFFYRVKQVEISGRSGYSDIRFITLVKKGSEVMIFPNPVKDGFYINVPLTDMDREKVKLSLFASNGQLVAAKEITGLQAANYYFNLTDRKLAAGQYSLQVILKDKTIATKMLTVNQ
jgi:hypothetical protein